MRYPEEEQLEKVKNWEVKNIEDFHAFMGYINEIVDWYIFTRKHDVLYSLSTGGWSGNEDVIGSMLENRMFWLMYWESSRRGGHYTFSPMGFEFPQESS